MKISKNKVAVITYDLHVEGILADKATAECPLDYIHGTHMLLPKFEEAIDGLEEGDTFAFTLAAEDGYGSYDPKARFDIPKTSFALDGKVREDLLVEGRLIPMLNSEGEVCHAQIIEVKGEAVTVDFNHPMAGKSLDFTGQVLSVRDATEKELLEGLHGEYLPKEEHSCGCGHCHGEGHHHGNGEGCCHGGEGHHHGNGEGCCHGGEGHHHGEGCCHHHES